MFALRVLSLSLSLAPIAQVLLLLPARIGRTLSSQKLDARRVEKGRVLLCPTRAEEKGRWGRADTFLRSEKKSFSSHHPVI